MQGGYSEGTVRVQCGYSEGTGRVQGGYREGTGRVQGGYREGTTEGIPEGTDKEGSREGVGSASAIPQAKAGRPGGGRKGMALHGAR